MNEIEQMILEHKHQVTYNWRDWAYGVVDGPIVVIGLGTVTVEKKEIWGDLDSYIIFKVSPLNDTPRYYKKTFYTSSFGDLDPGPFVEVRPTTRMITEFE